MSDKQIINWSMRPADMLENVYVWLREYGRVCGREWTEHHAELAYILDQIFTDTGNGNTGDYSRPDVQALYLLRYLNCYAYGYMDMYRTFLRTYEAELRSLNKAQLFVTSFGCGNQVDLWGLCDAIRQVNGPVQVPVYIGVDINPWAEAFQLFPEGFVRCGIADYLNARFYPEAADVYVFAKCISEFNPGECLRICSGLPGLLNSHLTQRKFWILFYLRTREGQPYVDDLEICRSICGSVQSAGYIMRGGNQPPAPWGGETYIHTLDRRFDYPQGIKRDLWDNGSYPMSKTRNIYYWITYFERADPF